MPPIVITLGDPAGIGPEVTLKAIEKLNTHPGIILVGHPSCIPQKFPTFTSYTEANKIYIYPISQYEPQSKEDDATNAKIAYQSILSALELSKKIKIKGLVTAPISKTGLKNAKLNLMDHTSILKSFFNCPDAGMAFYSEQLKIMLATIHIPLVDVESELTKETINTAINNAIDFGHSIGLKKPRIGIAGLNPHAGENGQIGIFEKKHLSPWIKTFNKTSSTKVVGPISPDIIFKRGLDGTFDIILAMYHDQGLIPLKLLAFDHAVNVTIGLPICRTSPDHGTAYDIAGKNIANPSAMEAAIKYVMQFGL